MKDEQSWEPSKFSHHAGRISVGPAASDGSWLLTQLVAKAYEKNLPLYARGKLVDLGCGTVPLYDAYRSLVSEVTCVDWAGNKHNARHLDVEHDLNQPLPLPSDRFDTAILSDVLEHIRRPEQLLGEVARILAPGGKLLLNVPFFYWLHEQPYDYFRYSEHALRAFVEQSGLRLVSLEGLGGAPDILADIVGKHVSQLPVLGGVAARLLQRGSWAVGKLPALSRALAPSSQRFPMAYFLVAEKS
jgi:SAM-dependent methyltransferase